MANYPNQILTDVGMDALTEALTGKKIAFVRMVVGDGQQPGITPEQLQQRTSLIHEVMDVPITDYRSVGEGRLSITGTLRSTLVTTGFHMSEIGIYCELDDTPPQILYSICNSGTDTDYIPSKDEATVVIQAIEVQIIIHRAQNFTVNVVLGDISVEGENIGPTGANVYAQRVVNRLQFKRLVSTSGIHIRDGVDTIELNVGDPVDGGGGNGSLPPGQGAGVIMTGTIVPFAGATAPIGYLLCDGASYLRTQYPRLSAVLLSLYGGNATHFNVPDCQERSLTGAGVSRTLGERYGSNSIVLATGNLPSHTHGVDINHYHSISVNSHNHHDPGHSHGVNDGYHSHTYRQPVQSGFQYQPMAGGPQIGYTDGVATGGSWAGVSSTQSSGSNLQASGTLGGSTAWLSAMGANEHLRTTGASGSGTPIGITPPSLAVNYIIKT